MPAWQPAAFPILRTSSICIFHLAFSIFHQFDILHVGASNVAVASEPGVAIVFTKAQRLENGKPENGKSQRTNVHSQKMDLAYLC
jgi:hypothetical protein